MVKKINDWYENKFKQYPAVTLIITIGVIVVSIGTFLTNIREIHGLFGDVYQNIFLGKYHNEYDLIKGLNVGISLNYLVAKLGTPLFETEFFRDEKGAIYYEMAYSAKPYFLHFVLNEDKSVVLYTVIARKEDFHPIIPLPGGKEYKLGVSRLADLSDSPKHIAIDYSSKFWYYTETNYFGNLGFYRYYLFGLTPLGTDYSKNESDNYPYFPSEEEIEKGLTKSEIIEKKRKRYIPNAFCITSEFIDVDLLDYVQNYYLGFDYFYARTLD